MCEFLYSRDCPSKGTIFSLQCVECEESYYDRFYSLFSEALSSFSITVHLHFSRSQLVFIIQCIAAREIGGRTEHMLSEGGGRGENSGNCCRHHPFPPPPLPHQQCAISYDTIQVFTYIVLIHLTIL